MNANQNRLERYTETRVRYLFDSEAVAREKRYKLGEWLHGEYRDKFKKAAKHAERT